MTFPNKLVRLQFGGPLFTQESWSIGLHFTGTVAPIPAEDLKPIVEGFFDTMINGAKHETAELSFIKFNELDHQTGKYVNPGASNSYYYVTPHTATGVPSNLPQGATCVSLLTAAQRGRGHAGRIFLPGYATVNTDGHTAAGQMVATATHVAEFINSVAFLSGLQAVIWSKIGDLVKPITGVKVGDVVDTQRRRRSSLPETYHASTVSVPA